MSHLGLFYFDFDENEKEIDQSCESRGMESIGLDRQDSHMTEITYDDYNAWVEKTDEMGWYMYTLEAFIGGS